MVSSFLQSFQCQRPGFGSTQGTACFSSLPVNQLQFLGGPCHFVQLLPSTTFPMHSLSWMDIWHRKKGSLREEQQHCAFPLCRAQPGFLCRVIPIHAAQLAAAKSCTCYVDEQRSSVSCAVNQVPLISLNSPFKKLPSFYYLFQFFPCFLGKGDPLNDMSVAQSSD